MLAQIARYRRAANFLAAAQVYLQDNCLLEQPLRPEHIKPRLLGHWGTAPGINLIYAHLASSRGDGPARYPKDTVTAW
jgi:xylulose-5-phosphate/fructose-6-phosphate phosphoketolase